MLAPDVRDALIALVLPWVEATDRAKYDATLAVAVIPATFEKYLLRLLELRWAADRDARGTFPLALLDATAITARARLGAVGEVTLGGARAAACDYRWSELTFLLTLDPDARVAYHAAKRDLDLQFTGVDYGTAVHA